MLVSKHLLRFFREDGPPLIPNFTLHQTGVYLANTSRCCWWSLALRDSSSHHRCTFACTYTIKLQCHRLSTFLWHYPHSHLHWTLSSGLSYGARTFLNVINFHCSANPLYIAIIYTASFCSAFLL